MSELYAKEADNPNESGWGFEFTFRVARDTGDTEPPMWAANLLQNLARYVSSSGTAMHFRFPVLPRRRSLGLAYGHRLAEL
jgi:hypothetical protein